MDVFCYYCEMVPRSCSNARWSFRVAILLALGSGCSVFGLSEDELTGANPAGGGLGGAGGVSGSAGSGVTGGTWAGGSSGVAGEHEDASTDGSAGAAAAAGAGGSPNGGGAGGTGNTGGAQPCPFPTCFAPGAACGDNCECCSVDCKDQLCN